MPKKAAQADQTEPTHQEQNPADKLITHSDEPQLSPPNPANIEPEPAKPAHNALVHPSVIADNNAALDAREMFIRQLEVQRNVPEVVYTPPQPSARQQTRREAEMAAGAAAAARRQGEMKPRAVIIPRAPAVLDAQGRPSHMPRPPQNPVKEGTNTEVFRPQDYTHERDSKGARTTRSE